MRLDVHKVNNVPVAGSVFHAAGGGRKSGKLANNARAARRRGAGPRAIATAARL